MIIVSMGAGLGNQMFEYAFYQQMIQLYPNQTVKVDTNYAFPPAHNGIEVFSIFGLNANVADYCEVKKLTKYYPLGNEKNKCVLLEKVIKKLRIHPRQMIIQRDFSEFENAFFALGAKNYYLYGPFANYKYFEKISDTVRRIYKFPPIQDERNMKYKDMIESSYAVSIHIRRGDYLSENVEMVTDNYYFRAIDIIEAKRQRVTYFVFSDDIGYAKKLFSDKGKYVIVEGNSGVNSFRDMQLMSLCRDNIIVNSTFSFWGAYLNCNEDKLVIAPNLPFTGCKCPFSCDEWLLI